MSCRSKNSAVVHLTAIMRFNASSENGRKTPGILPPVAISATAPQIAAEFLKPWPEQADTTMVPAWLGSRSIKKLTLWDVALRGAFHGAKADH